MMKKLVSLFALLVLAAIPGVLPLRAQEGVLQDFLKKTSVSRVSFDYSFSVPAGRTKMEGSGNVLLQGDAFRVEGNGLDIRCDGKTRWTVDTDGEEAVIEPVDDSGADFYANPALLVVAVDKAFREVSSGKATFRGKGVRQSVLKPLDDSATVAGSEIESLKLYFASDKAEMLGAEFTMEDGSVTVFLLSQWKFAPASDDLAPFRFSASAFGANYVVTDLR